jgi:uncharacterized protein (TIGR03435 family)
MKIADDSSVGGNKFFSAVRALTIFTAIVLGLASAAPSHAQAVQQALERAMSTATSATAGDSPSTVSADSPIVAKFEYEVASIKLSKAGSANGMFRFGMRNTDDGLSVENFPLMLLVQQAYGVGKDRITGAPDWLNSEHYDIEAKMDGAAAEELKTLAPDVVRAARQHMLRKLLEQRFELTVHRETKDLPVYNLVIAKGGSKLQESKPDDNAGRGDKPTDPALAAALAAKMGSASGPAATGGGGNASGGGKSITVVPGGNTSFSMSSGRGGVRTTSARGATTASLATSLASIAGRPVLDKTGLTGKYDYKLEYSPEDSQPDADPTGPSIFTAVQEQLGLKLEAAKGPVEIVVIDHIGKPSGN